MTRFIDVYKISQTNNKYDIYIYVLSSNLNIA